MLRFLGIRIIVYLIPASLIAYGDHQIVFDFFTDHNKQKILESICFFTGLMSTIIIFPLVVENQKKHINAQSETIKLIYGNLRDTINQSLSLFFNEPDLYLNIRIFLPQNGIKNYFLKLFKKELYFEAHNFNGLFVERVDKLTFQVSPVSQGLVGICFKDQKIWHDFNLKNNHGKKEYRLNSRQIQVTNYCEFGIAAPMYNNDNIIDAIITFDSKVKVKEPASDDWEEIIKNGCKTIYYSKALINYKNMSYE